MQQEPRLNRIEPLPGAASGYRILLSENAGRLASRSVLGPTLMTPLFAVQAVMADSGTVNSERLDSSDVLAWVVTPVKANQVKAGDTFIIATRNASLPKIMRPEPKVAGPGKKTKAGDKTTEMLKWLRCSLGDTAPMVSARLEGIIIITFGDLASVLIAVQPDNMTI